MSHRSPRDSHHEPRLRSRQAIAAYLDRVGGYDSSYGQKGRSYFAFNVKCHAARLDFMHLLAVYRESGYYGDGETWLENPEWLVQARAKYEDVKDTLFDCGVEEASRLLTDSDGFNHLDDGTPVAVTYCWMGRSGGHVGLRTFAGFDFSQDRDHAFWRAVFEGNPHRRGSDAWFDWDRDTLTMDDGTLRTLYALIVMLDRELTPARASAEVEHQAAFQLIENVCCDIPRYAFFQQLLPLGGRSDNEPTTGWVSG